MIVAPNAAKFVSKLAMAWEGELNRLSSSVIIQQEIFPHFKKLDYPRGINNGADALIAALDGEYTAPKRLPEKKEPMSFKNTDTLFH